MINALARYTRPAVLRATLTTAAFSSLSALLKTPLVAPATLREAQVTRPLEVAGSRRPRL
jgi:hypothetical protein